MFLAVWHTLLTLQLRPSLQHIQRPSSSIPKSLRIICLIFILISMMCLAWFEQSLSRLVYGSCSMFSSLNPDRFAHQQKKKQKFKLLQVEVSIPKVLLLNMKVWWSSTFMMLVQARDLKTASHFTLNISLSQAHIYCRLSMSLYMNLAMKRRISMLVQKLTLCASLMMSGLKWSFSLILKVDIRKVEIPFCCLNLPFGLFLSFAAFRDS